MQRLPPLSIIKCNWTRPTGETVEWLCRTTGKMGRYPSVVWTHYRSAASCDVDPSILVSGGSWAPFRDDDGIEEEEPGSIPSSEHVGDIISLSVHSSVTTCNTRGPETGDPEHAEHVQRKAELIKNTNTRTKKREQLRTPNVERNVTQ
jgi:hypothetical protein